MVVSDSDTVVTKVNWANPIEISFKPISGWLQKKDYQLMIFSDGLTPIEGKSLNDSIVFINIKSEKALGYGGLSGVLAYESQSTILELINLENKSKKECIDIYFAKANILHFEKKYKESAKNLVLGNESKRTITIMDTDELIKKSFFLLNQSNEETYCSNKISNNPESIFIVGMPRCGSTLLESILSMNKQVNALGEVNILEDSYNEIYQNSNKEKKKTSLYERYLEKIKILNKSSPITTNKLLYNFQYTGIILKNIPRSKIVFCYRDPLDNILSIYRAHFSKSNYYASSIIETAQFYAHHKDIMNKYIEKYIEKIYALNYDLLVSDPSNEIKKMITWLGWEWNDFYLTPHLNKRSVSTASNIQVRSPINNNSLGGWKNYRDILKPAIEIIENKKI